MMSQQPDANPGAPVASPPPKRSFLRNPTTVIILLLVIIWLVVMAFRWELRAQWWAYAVTQAETAQDRDFYVTRLASIRDKSLNAVPRLFDNPDPAIRIAGVTVLRYCESDRAFELLLGMLSDENEDVSGAAASAIAWRPNAARHVPALEEVLRNQPPATWGVTVALGRIGGDDGERILRQILSTSDDPNVKAQAIDSLGLLGCREAIPLIRQAMADQGPVDRMPYSQLSAMRAISALGSDLAAKGIDPNSAAASAATTPTVSGVAKRWLRLLSATATSTSPGR